MCNKATITIYNYDNYDSHDDEDNEDNEEVYIDRLKKSSDISISSYESGLYSFSYNPIMFESYLLRLIENYIQRNI